MNDIVKLSVKQLLEGEAAKKFSQQDIIEAYLQRIKTVEGKINAFITLVDKRTLRVNLDKKEKKGKEEGKLRGIPFAMKDAYVTKGIKTTAGSNVLDGYIPQYSATVYNRLTNEGAILLGKNSQDAWGHGSTSENTDFKVVANPWNLSHVAGGSSGGCAAAIASCMVPFAIGEDTGGSIRNPSSFCSVTGLKVTYGRVSRYGAIAYASSLDTVGPMARSVEDISYILSVIAGKDSYDATSSSQPVANYSLEITKNIKNVVLGIPKEFFQKGTDPQVSTAVKKAVTELEHLGVKTTEVSMPSIDIGVAAYYLLAPSETSSNLGRYDGVRYGGGRDKFTTETMRRIMIGTYALSAGYYDAYYKKSLKARTIIINDYKKAFEKCDVLVGPVVPTVAPKRGEIIDDPIKLMLSDVYTLTQNIAGIPSLALPCGFSKEGLPIGMQIMGKMFDEQTILRVGHAYQQITDWHTKVPNLD